MKTKYCEHFNHNRLHVIITASQRITIASQKKNFVNTKF